MRTATGWGRTVGCLWLVAWVGCAPSPDGEPALAARRLTALEGDEGRPAWSPDGRLVLFTARGEGGGLDLALLDLASDSLRWLTRTAAAWESDGAWAEGGRTVVARVAAADGAALVAYPVDGGMPRELVPPATRASAPWVSPDGGVVAYTTGRPGGTDVWTVPLAGGEPVQVCACAGPLWLVGWSFDGRAFIGTRLEGAGQEIISIDRATGTVTDLTRHPHEEWAATPSPASARIAFYTTYDGDMTDIRVVDPDGSIRRLTDHPTEDFAPAWSPDGRRIAFLSDRASKSEVWTVDVESGVAEAVLGGFRAEWSPAWSPTGDALVVQHRAARERLFRVDPATGTVEPVGPDSLDMGRPVVSPDGRRLAFTTMDFGSEGDVGLLDLGTGAVRALTRNVASVLDPSWSPDGRSLAVRLNEGGWYRTADLWVLDAQSGETARRTGEGWLRTGRWCGADLWFTRPTDPDRPGSQALWAMPPGGGPARVVADHPGVELPTDCDDRGRLLYTLQAGPSSEIRRLTLDGSGTVVGDEVVVPRARDGSAGPDGRIAFVAEDGGAPDLFVLDPATGERRRVTDTPWPESAPDWSPDGAWIYFSAAEGDVDLWWVPVPEGGRTG